MNRFFVIAIGFVMLVGCLKTRAELEAEESGAVQQKQTVAQQQPAPRAAGAPAPVKEKAPPSAYRFEEYDEQMRQLTGRVDSVENAINQMNEGKQGEKDSFGKEKAAIDQKFLAYEEALKKLELQIAALNEEVTRLKTPPPEPPPAATVGGKVKSPYEVGDEQFTAKKWKDAIVNFQKYRDAAPKGKLYPDASYKIGVCFQELGMKDEARAFYEEVGAKFPASKEAKKAAARLKTLK